MPSKFATGGSRAAHRLVGLIAGFVSCALLVDLHYRNISLQVVKQAAAV